MAYTNSVGIMPGAATEKLPFVHSDFKPRSKFAKCFGGFKKYTRNSNGTEKEYEGQKLPLIHYSVGDQRNLITLGPKNRSDRPEYPGFAGKKKLLKKKENSANVVHPAISGSFTRSQASAMKHYLSLPNLNAMHQYSEPGYFHNVRSSTNFDKKHRHRRRDNDELEFLNYSQQLHQQQQQLQQQLQQQQNRNNNPYSMDSLFIVDDDDDDDDAPQNNSMVVVNGVRFADPAATTQQHDSFHRGSPNSNNSFPAEYELMNPFAKEVDKKLREARGKSGMKRDRRREPDHSRILGDVVTAERMNELLLPRKSEGPLNFAENV